MFCFFCWVCSSGLLVIARNPFMLRPCYVSLHHANSLVSEQFPTAKLLKIHQNYFGFRRAHLGFPPVRDPGKARGGGGVNLRIWVDPENEHWFGHRYDGLFNTGLLVCNTPCRRLFSPSAFRGLNLLPSSSFCSTDLWIQCPVLNKHSGFRSVEQQYEHPRNRDYVLNEFNIINNKIQPNPVLFFVRK